MNDTPRDARSEPRTYWKKMARLITGWIFIIFGVIGLFLPILQGILFLALGIYLLAPCITFFHRMQERLYARHPHLKNRVQHMHETIKRVGCRLINKQPDEPPTKESL